MHNSNSSQTVKASSRTYFFDLKETQEGKRYLVITESRKTDADQFERNSVNVFPEHAVDFLEAAQEMIGRVA